MPTGSELLTPGEPAPKSNADASAYGCYLASRPFSDDVSFHSKYLHFPEEMVEAADGETERFAYGLEVSSPEITDPLSIRYANCTIPSAEGAEEMVYEQLLLIGEEVAAEEALHEETGAASKSCTTFSRWYVAYCAGSISDPYQSCTLGYETVTICDGGGSTNDDGSNPFPDGGSGGSPPDEDGGSDESECTDRRDLNPEPGSGCEPMDPCESDNPPEHCDDEEDDPCVPSLSDLESIFENAETEVVEDVHEAIEENISEFDIGGELEVAHFLGQVYHETGGLTTLEEGLNYTTAERLKEIWPSRFSETDPDLPDPNDYLEDPEKLANYVYADRMGNGDEESGDGWKYRGRGLFQLTGKNNYQAFTDFYQDEFDSSLDFVNTPGEIESDTELATISGMWFYDENVLSHIDEVTIEDVTRLINIGRAGQEERESKTNEAEQAIDCQ
ncbi:MAG: hypothetical protein PPP56_13655 [Longimonas sp.]|uniref:glycoside hydrolase family 19 protein n=1 Tax=Longimonas sp. TaxID=2039626 RepID=UPI003354440E